MTSRSQVWKNFIAEHENIDANDIGELVFINYGGGNGSYSFNYSYNPSGQSTRKQTAYIELPFILEWFYEQKIIPERDKSEKKDLFLV